jgi:hypothetical protein
VQDWRRKWHAASGGQTPAEFGFGICEIAPVIPSPTDRFAGTAIRWFQTGRLSYDWALAEHVFAERVFAERVFAAHVLLERVFAAHVFAEHVLTYS